MLFCEFCICCTPSEDLLDFIRFFQMVRKDAFGWSREYVSVSFVFNSSEKSSVAITFSFSLEVFEISFCDCCVVPLPIF